MNVLWISLVGWLVDFQLLAAGLLVAALAASWLLRQPAARLAVLRPTLGGLAVLALLAATPGWSLVHLRSEPPSAAVPLPVPAEAAQAMPRPPFPGVQPEYQPPLAKIAPLAPIESPPLTVASPGDAALAPALPRIVTSLALVFVAGAAAAAGWLALGGWQTRGIVRRARPASAELAATLAAITAPCPAPRLCVSEEIAVAAAVGLRRPRILLPGAKPQAAGDAGEEDATADVTAILAHEWAHIRHGDLRTIALCRWLLVLLWPQPLYWLLRRTVRLDQETLADAAAAELTSRADYAERLVAWARRSTPGPRPPRLAAAAGLWESPSQLKRRVLTLLDEKFTVLRECSRRWKIAWRVAAATVAIGLSTITLEPGEASDPPQSDETAASISSLDSESKLELAAKPQQATATAGLPGPLDNYYHFRGITETSDKEPNAIKTICVDEKGKPIAGARVIVVKGLPLRGPQQIVHEGETDADGKFAWVGVVPLVRGQDLHREPDYERLQYGIAISASRRVSRELALDEKTILEHGLARRITMPRAVSLKGLVTDDAGNPVAGAAVVRDLRMVRQMGFQTAVTDAQGRFEIADLAPFDLEAHRRQREEEKEKERQQSIPSGGFRLTADIPGPRFWVTHADFAATRTEAQDIPGNLNVVLKAGGRLEGRVVRPSGEPAAAIIVRAARSRPMRIVGDSPPVPDWNRINLGEEYDVAAATDDDGRYEFPGMPPGSYDVWIESSDLLCAGLPDFKVAPGRSTKAPPLSIVEGEPLDIKLVDADTGEPLTANGPRTAEVVAQWFQRPGRVESRPRQVELRPDGTMTVRLLPGKSLVFVMSVIEDGAPAADLPAGSLPAQPHVVEIVAGKKASVELRMQVKKGADAPPAAPSGAILPKFKIKPANDGPAEWSHDDGARAEVVVAPSEVQGLQGESPSDEPTKLLQDAARAFYKKHPPAPNVIAGLCHDEAGAPLAGAEVSLYLYAGMQGEAAPAEKITTATTGDDGAFRFEDAIDAVQTYPQGVPDEQFQTGALKLIVLLAKAPGRATAWHQETAVAVLKRGDTTFLKLTPAGTLRGRVLDDQGQPLQGARVSTNRFLQVAGLPLTAATTDAQGRFAIADLEVYDAAAARKKFEAWTASLREKLPPNEFQALESTRAGEVFSPVAGGGMEFQGEVAYAQHPRFVMGRVEITSVPGEVEFRLAPGATLTGRVVRQDRGRTEPAGGTRLYLRRKLEQPAINQDGTSQPAKQWSATFVQIQTVVADAQGTYRVDSLPAGSYQILVEGNPDWATPRVETVDVTLGETHTAPDVVFTRGGVIRVQLVDAQSKQPLSFPGPQKGYLHPMPRDAGVASGFAASVVEFSAQRVGERRVVPGKYVVWANIPPQDFYTEPGAAKELTSLDPIANFDDLPTYDVADGQTVDVTLTMREQSLAISGRFVPAEPPSEQAENSTERIKQGNEADAADGASTGRDLERAQRLVADAKYAEALAAYERLLTAENELHRAIALNNLAHLLATCPDVTVRNGGRAVKLAEGALALAPAEARAEILDTLGAAQWEAGDSDQALATLREAVDAANDQPGVQAKLEATRQRYETALRKQKQQPKRAASTASP